MYLWKVDLLVEDFKSGKVTQKDELKYMLLLSITLSIACDPILYADISYNYLDTINSVMAFIISLGGIFYCYKVNSSGDDKDFIVRMICIGFPVLIRVLCVMIPIIIVAVEIFLVYPESIEDMTIENTPIQVFIVAVTTAAYYWYLSKKIRDVSSE